METSNTLNKIEERGGGVVGRISFPNCCIALVLLDKVPGIPGEDREVLGATKKYFGGINIFSLYIIMTNLSQTTRV